MVAIKTVILCTVMLSVILIYTGEGQFGVVHRALAEGICSFDYGRKVVAVKTLKCKPKVIQYYT